MYEVQKHLFVVWKHASQEKCNNECSLCITTESFCVGGVREGGGGGGGTGLTGSAPEVVVLCREDYRISKT